MILTLNANYWYNKQVADIPIAQCSFYSEGAPYAQRLYRDILEAYEALNKVMPQGKVLHRFQLASKLDHVRFGLAGMPYSCFL